MNKNYEIFISDKPRPNLIGFILVTKIKQAGACYIVLNILSS